jgi:hypothetical protein
LALNHGYAAELGEISSNWLFYVANTLGIPPGTMRASSSSSPRNVDCRDSKPTRLCPYSL